MSDTVLKVEDLKVSTRDGHQLLNGVSLSIAPGETVGIIGESGSGKSLTALSIMGLHSHTLHSSGHITLRDQPGNLLDYSPRRYARLRGRRISMVFQEPMTALNPLMKIGPQVREALKLHQPNLDSPALRRRSVELLDQVRLPDPEELYGRYPHQLSGGQRQRVLIAIALANDPELIICDEPTTALDATVQASILDTLTQLAQQRGTAVLFITHDLGVMARMCERVMVMRRGEIVERGSTQQVLHEPTHSYTRGLVAASDLAARDPQGRLYTVGSADESYSPGHAHARPEFPALGPVVLEADGISKSYRFRGWRARSRRTTQALAPVSLQLRAGQRLGVVGESGSGKSSLVRLLAGLDTSDTGAIRVDGRRASSGVLQASSQMVFQDPAASLDPRMRVGESIAEPLRAARMSTAERAERVREVLADVGLEPDVAQRYPHEFSGGQRQRISLARALAPRPRVLLADEPVSALDVSARAQVINLLTQVVHDYQLGLVFVSHDLGVVQALCSEVMVLRRGELIEQEEVAALFSAPRASYTRALIDAVPQLHP
ncbi:Glutathione import ATP-binding protein GsiA [Corynebacterium ciconiae DSM 44920]|uniref:dipeptide ABC transporter ATP-binding protein n=1 Tax=Corynebacterium ciconiae TaxID=227319 RepID=UPI0003688EB8|nr:ABC transporter ATP-binding protein [Corynebacterium ciconiae]WKD60645.1 Glutathione import ATP-binding protein GsiA [Corynebacterium ciconiae DSM 44920]